MLRCVPFNAVWISHDKLDLHAIYRRPVWLTDPYGDVTRAYDERGAPKWDLTTALPVRQHNKFVSKGFEYVTLADRGSLLAAAAQGTVPGPVSDYVQNVSGGPWHPLKYLEGMQQESAAEAKKLAEMVAQFGPDAVEQIKRASDPSFRLPAVYWPPLVEVDSTDRHEPVATPSRRRGRPRKPKREAVPV